MSNQANGDINVSQNTSGQNFTELNPKDVIESNLSAKDLADLPIEEVTISAHEARTVLTVMRNYLWVSTYQNDEPLGPKVKRNLSIVTYALDYLVTLIENNLTVTKLEKNQIKLTLEAIDLVEVINSMVGQYSEKAKTLGVTILHEPSPPKAPIKADIQKTKDIIGRIIDNALKFTPAQGKISFKIVESDDEGYYEVRISDTGPGIAKIDQQKMFKKYSKIKASYSNVRGESGAGLGLYIAKCLTEMQNGKIDVRSDAGAGAIFVVSLPKVVDSGQLSVDSQKGQ